MLRLAGEAAKHPDQQFVGSEAVGLHLTPAAFQLGQFEDRAEKAEQPLAR